MLCNHNTGQGHLRSPGEKGQTNKNRDLELRYMFLGRVRFSRRTRKMTSKHFLKLQNRSKNEIREITVVSKYREVPVFDMFYGISQPVLKISTWNFVHIFMRHCPLTYVTFFFVENFDLGETVSKRKKITFFIKKKNLEIFKMLKIRDSSSVALLILRQFI